MEFLMKNNPRSPNDLTAKKSAVLKPKRSLSRLTLILVLAATVGTAALAFYITELPRPQTGHPGTPTAAFSPTVGDISIPVEKFENGRAQYFEHRSGDLTVRYFILKSADGVLRAAFDACDVCWPSGMGYEQQGDEMICRNCGMRFASNRVNDVSGGCNPAPLTRSVQGDQLVIKSDDIDQGRRYFDFKKGA
jgi:uncharacterized membrane protein